MLPQILYLVIFLIKDLTTFCQIRKLTIHIFSQPVAAGTPICPKWPAMDGPNLNWQHRCQRYLISIKLWLIIIQLQKFKFQLITAKNQHRFVAAAGVQELTKEEFEQFSLSKK